MAVSTTVAFIASAVIGVASTVASMQAQKRAAKKQRAAMERQRKAQEEAGQISAAQQKAAELRQRRQAAREARVKRAAILNQAEQTGVGGSSGALGSSSAIGTNLGDAVSVGRGNTKAAEGIRAQRSAGMQAGIDAQLAAASASQQMSTIGAFSKFANMGLGLAQTDLFGGTTPSYGNTSTGRYTPSQLTGNTGLLGGGV